MTQAFGLAKVALLISILLLGITDARVSCAEDAADGGLVQPDPPGREYFTGLEATPPEMMRSFRREGVYRAFLPRQIDLSPYFPAPGDQGRIGSCTAWATGYAARGYYAVRAEGRKRNSQDDIPSPDFIFNSIKTDETCKTGSAVSAALKLLLNGAVSMSRYPYPRNTCAKIEQPVADLAHDFKIQGWVTLDYSSPDNLKGELAKGNPVIVGLWLDKQFNELRGPTVYSATTPGDGNGHAMVITGYDDERQAFRLINSWGRGWGDKGYVWIAYDTMTKVAREAFAMRVDKKVPPEPIIPNVVNAPGCSSIQEKSDGGKVVISGFVETDADLKKLHQQYANKPAEFNVDIRPWPQCEVTQTLQSQLNGADLPVIETSAANGAISSGHVLSISVKAPNWPAYIYTAYIQADGSVVILSQPNLAPPTPQDRNAVQVFGDGKNGRATFKVGSPFGHELIVVLAARSPLFETSLPATLTERDFLSRLRKALIYKPKPDEPDRQVSAAITPIETQEK